MFPKAKEMNIIARNISEEVEANTYKLIDEIVCAWFDDKLRTCIIKRSQIGKPVGVFDASKELMEIYPKYKALVDACLKELFAGAFSFEVIDNADDDFEPSLKIRLESINAKVY